MKHFFVGAILIASVPSFAVTMILPATQTKIEITGRDIGIRKVQVDLNCYRKATLSETMSNGGTVHMPCKNLKVNGVLNKDGFQSVDFKAIGNNLFGFDELDIQYDQYRSPQMCLKIRTILEIDVDSIDYETPNDKWTMLSYCTGTKILYPINVNVYSHKKEATLESFLKKLEGPLLITFRR